MTKRIELPGPGEKYIEVKDVGDMSSGDVRAAKGSVSVEVDPATGHQIIPGDYNERMHAGLAARIITGWNLQWPLPKGNPAVLDELTPAQFKALEDGLEEHVEFVNKLQEKIEPGTDPTSA